MKRTTLNLVTSLFFAALCANAPAARAADADAAQGNANASAKGAANASANEAAIRRTVDAAIEPLMAKDGIHGMAVGVIVAGQPYVFDYGVASAETGKPVTRDTLFELGSVSKTFTASLASYAQVNGKLALTDRTSQYLPALQGTPFGDVRLVSLGTHTPGVLPLQVPDEIHDDAQFLQYLKAWKPGCAQGTCRTYSNPGIGTLGMITAKSMGGDFTALMQQRVFPALGLKHTYIDVPPAQMPDYAQGYKKDGAPIRVAPGVLSAEAYGVKTTAADMTRFVQANMGLVPLDGQWQRALTDTHIGYYRAGGMTQDLIWEQYRYPVALSTLQEGNSSKMALTATPVTAIEPPQAPRQDVWINKTGSTNGFGSYVAFIPGKQLGIVMLANKNVPIPERVAVAHRILTALDAQMR
ncbi:beta-lactamase [Paraburkholderia sp. D15]|uniref:class C beta-lactamase n=1 Tax=Paraburkholderia sp. D15 TaxID=2880218 RepID=UPI0024793494|nr:class C beta-lactamase [Paraburkholderia sp. D15]WGS53355.1 beta-lactamase [Paraburkholderia sp. D15]